MSGKVICVGGCQVCAGKPCLDALFAVVSHALVAVGCSLCVFAVLHRRHASTLPAWHPLLIPCCAGVLALVG